MSRIIILFIIGSHVLFAQQPLSMEEAVALALVNHPVARNVALAEQKDQLMHHQAVEIAPIQMKYWQGNTKTGNNHLWAVTQDFGVIPEHFRRAQYYRTLTTTRQAERLLTVEQLKWQVKSAYMDAVYQRQRFSLMQQHDHYFEALVSLAEIYLVADSVSELTRVSAETRYASFQSHMYIAEEELKRAETLLCQLLYLPGGKIVTEQTELDLYLIHPEKSIEERFEPVKHYAVDEAQLTEAKSFVKLEKTKLFPALHVGYINRHIAGMNNYGGWMAGLSVPMWIQPQRARIKAAEIEIQMKANETEYRQFANKQYIEMLQSLLNEYFVQISFSRENLLVEAKLTLEEIEKDFSAGRITNFVEAFTKVSNAVSAKLQHLEYVSLYNQTALELEYFTQ